MRTKSLLRQWQKRLRLQDWNIEVVFVPKSVLGEDDEVRVLGDCTPDKDNGHALIRLRRGLGHDLERVLVHELLHVLDTEREEIRINKTAKALLGEPGRTVRKEPAELVETGFKVSRARK